MILKTKIEKINSELGTKNGKDIKIRKSMTTAYLADLKTIRT